MITAPLTIDFAQMRRDADAFGAKLAVYQRFSKLKAADVLRKKGGDLVIALSSPGKPGELRKLMPPKGSIRSGNLARMSRGDGGLKIHARARRIIYESRGIVQDIKSRRGFATASRGKAYKRGPKAVNVQKLLVKTELNLRESSRGYLAHGASFRRVKRIMDAENQAILNRAGVRIADAFLKDNGNASVLTIWDTVSRQLQMGLVAPASRAAVHNAFAVVSADMDIYLARKLQEAAKEAKLA